jgi:hypothetical protein
MAGSLGGSSVMFESHPIQETVLGDFNPLLLLLRINLDAALARADPAYMHEYERVAFHERVHFLQAIGTMFDIGTHSEVMDYIANTIHDMGGVNELILSGFSFVDPEYAVERVLNHFMSFHRISLDGHYGSRPVPMKAWLGEHEDFGVVELNKDTSCPEYIRWNRHDREYFATPLGSHSIHETLAYLLEHFIPETPRDLERIEIVRQFDAPSDSDRHYYNAALDLFWHLMADRQDTSEDKFATLVSILDLSLQTVPLDLCRKHPGRVDMTTPGLRLVRLMEAAREMPLVKNTQDDDYRRFTEEVSERLGWPSPRLVWQQCLTGLEQVLGPLLDDTSAAITAHPERFESYLKRMVSFMRREWGLLYADQFTPDVLEERLAEYEAAIRGNPLVYSGIFGAGIAAYTARAMRVRLEHPLWLVFPQRYHDELYAAFPLDTWWARGQPQQIFSAASIALTFDLAALRHLWPLTLQWARGKRSNLICGNQCLGMPCYGSRCSGGRCPSWSPGRARPAIRCTYTDVLSHFGLWRK